MNKTRYKISPAQQQVRLNEDIAELKRDVLAYDSGTHSAAGTIAGRIFTMLYDEPNSRNPAVSRATRAGRKPAQMPTCSMVGIIDRAELHGPVCTVAFSVLGATGFLPMLDFRALQLPHTMVSFQDWWTKPVFRDAIGNEFSRGSIIKTMRDTEVAHADGAIPAAYGAVMYEGMFAVEQHVATEKVGDPSIFRTIVRHAAHEVLGAFDPAQPKQPMNLQGHRIAPTVLVELFRPSANPDEPEVRIVDRRQVPVLIYLTADQELGERWHQGMGAFSVPPVLPTMRDDDPMRGQVRMRVVLANSNDVELQIQGSTVSRDHRTGAFLIRTSLSAPT